MSILFTCMGTSDPVRGYRDGPMLHIIRRYRPDKVYVFLSEEAKRLDGSGGRIAAVETHIRAKWGEPLPEFHTICTDIEDPSDMDAVSRPMTEAVLQLSNQYPGERLILNLSSRTPQMKMVMAFLATDMRLDAIGVQVKNPEKSSGSTERTNVCDYSVADELECNEDEDPSAPDRCIQPELMHIQRQRARDQIMALLDQRDYSAIYAMKNSMPENIKALVGHLDARDKMQTEIARNKAQNLDLPFRLYPAKSYRELEQVRETYLVLLNRCHRHQYEELILRLNPLVVKLELRLMKKALESLGFRLEQIIDSPYSDRPRFSQKQLRSVSPRLAEELSRSFSGRMREESCDVSMVLCLHILESLKSVFAGSLPQDKLPEESLELLSACDRLNDKCRNTLAHQLSSVTEQDMINYCGMPPSKLLNQIKELIMFLYPESADEPELFNIYKRCGDYIKEKLH